MLTEAVYLLDFDIRSQVDFLCCVYQAVHIDDATANDLPRVIEILQKYADLPADFTDASLIALCERLKTNLVATVDSDFTIYRDAAKHRFINIVLSTFFSNAETCVLSQGKGTPCVLLHPGDQRRRSGKSVSVARRFPGSVQCLSGTSCARLPG